jgi:glutathione S-transferase
MTIILYELQPTRSARVRWTLLELGIPFESIEGRGREIFAMPELAQNAREARRGLAVFDGVLKDNTWLVEDRFSVTDIFVGYAVMWARVQGLTADLPNVTAYAERILARPLCPYGALG